MPAASPQSSPDAPASARVTVTAADLIGLAASARQLNLSRFRDASGGGEHLSRLLGRGMEFDEARPYQPGDDPRNIDWRVTARSGRPYTKVFREERERPVFIAMDLRRSMHFATNGVFKSVLAAQIAAVLAWAAESGGDRVGGFLFAEGFHREIQPRATRRGVLTLINEICRAPVWPASSPPDGDAAGAAEAALRGVSKVSRSGSLVFVLTDGYNLNPRARVTLTELCRRHATVIMHIADPIEGQLPPPGRYLTMSPGRTARTLVVSGAAISQHRQAFEERAGFLADLAASSRSHYVAFTTTDDPVARLTDLYGARR